MDIEFLAENLCEGDTKRANCPTCGGRNTFTITKKFGEIVWNCYKVSCSTSGRKYSLPNINDIKNRINKKQQTAYPNLPFVLPEHVLLMDSPVLKTYVDKYNLKRDVFFDVKESRAVFPIPCMQTKKILGAVGRALLPDAYGPKWKRYDKQKDLMYFTDPNLDVGVLVEDCVSAESCYNAGFTGIALLGTSMHESRIKDLMPFKEIVIALDKDANMKALKIKKMLDPYMNCRVVFLPDDLKYFSPGVVQAIITKPPAYCPSL
tara:strand:- start:3887 stop:4672 length:786 start_codon:yes stop_codon:yes gene_type:complete